jgi:DNA-binding GntR family transcriptional regulator
MSSTPRTADLSTDAPTFELRLLDGAGEGLAQQVYRELREAICDYRLAPNQRLVQNALADQLGISRTPVRDALLRLLQEGLVRPAPWRGGFLVSEFTPHEVLEIYDVRIALEPLAAQQAAGRHSRTQIAELEDLNARISSEPGGSLSEHYALNHAFHSLVIEPCGNAILKRMLDQLWSMPSALRMYHQQVLAEAAISQMVEEHAGIVAALAEGDATLVRERLLAHLQGARSTALDTFDLES